MKLVNIFLFFVSSFVSSFVFSQNYLTLLDTDVFKGNAYDIPIYLVNNDPIRAIQYDMYIPEGFIFDIDNVIPSPILNNFTTLISPLGNNNYRFIVYTISNDIINSGNQTILTLPIFVENSIDLGQYTFEFSNVILSSETNQNISSDAPSLGFINVIEDSVAPVITLLGVNPVTIEVGSTYTDAGATATDNYDGDITSSIVVTGSVDTSTIGTYTLSYDVTDANGNVAPTLTRTVNVVDELSLESFDQINFSLYPNPSNGDVTLKYYLPELMDGVFIKVYDMLGRLVTVTTNEREQGIQQVNLDLNTLDKGNYILIICAGNNSREKFINNKILILK